MPFAHSTQIDTFLEAVDRHLKNVQHAATVLAALVIAADDAACSYAQAEPGVEGASGRLRVLIRLARDKGEVLMREIGDSTRVMSDRSAFFEHSTAESNPNDAIKDMLDEALFVLESGGVQPIILMFDSDERGRLGEAPLIRLVGLQQRALELLGPRTGEAGKPAGEVHQVLAEALELAKLLADGAEARTWTDEDHEAVGEGCEHSQDRPA
jgi:hypothetical protein